MGPPAPGSVDLRDVAGLVEPGALEARLRQELEETLTPLISQADRLEKKLDRLLLLLAGMDTVLRRIEPVLALLERLPFLRGGVKS